ncbi:flavoprotein [Halobacteriales archaeon QS_8_65_32]|nr:MAG: flavoprotein [Halobacteriales archaeon QS_8_65_32]
MTEHEHYEAIVVGCGPGGATAAATLARNGVETLVLERGVEAGSKNVSGGVIYAEESAPYTIDDLFPDFREAASERPITHNYIHNIAGEKVKTFDLTDIHEHDTEWADAVLRRKMDSHLERRVHELTRETGGGVLTGVHANGLYREDSEGRARPSNESSGQSPRDGEIVGVTTDELEPITGDLIVAADGVNSELARDAGLMDWDEPDEWFQGVKAIVDMPEGAIEERFDIAADRGETHLFSGDLYEGVRGGGFLYTNESTLSIGNVFHLDSIVEERAEVVDLLDALLTHPLLAQWIGGDEYEELEYSAKLVPDSKKVAHPSPTEGRLVLVGDAAGQMQAQGPLIKGMNHAVTAGALVGEAFAVARSRGDTATAGERYVKKLYDEGVMAKIRPAAYDQSRKVTEHRRAASLTDRLVESSVGRAGLDVLVNSGAVERLYNSPRMMQVLPDTTTPYATLPTAIAERHGERITEESTVEPPTLEERIGDLTYDTDIGNPHIVVEDDSWEASGAAVTACPVSAKGFGGGCYREEVRSNGHEERVVSFDSQPCVECGTCAIVADTTWTHPRGGKGVEFEQG